MTTNKPGSGRAGRSTTTAKPRKPPTMTKESRYREGMRRRGFRLVSMWVPDTRNPAFRAELERQAALIARQESAADLAFIESALTEIDGWTA
ncbi:antitoxin MazE family protein [Dokdonella soli]|uniref:DUF3018 family protein n=1 Tax=Dokdonella soli TaxID=529810 RepID=A0ABN1IC76_9GAMM